MNPIPYRDKVSVVIPPMKKPVPMSVVMAADQAGYHRLEHVAPGLPGEIGFCRAQGR